MLIMTWMIGYASGGFLDECLSVGGRVGEGVREQDISIVRGLPRGRGLNDRGVCDTI